MKLWWAWTNSCRIRRTARPAVTRKTAPAEASERDGERVRARRTRGNTLDLRGERVEEALDLVDAFLTVDSRGEVAGSSCTSRHGSAQDGRARAPRPVELRRALASGRAGRWWGAFTLFWLKS